MNIDPHWTKYITAFSVPVIASIGLLIAYRQWKTAQNKLKFELFEKRLKVYNSTVNFFYFILRYVA